MEMNDSKQQLRSTIGGPGVWAFHWGRYTIVWSAGESQPSMTIKSATGPGEIVQKVANRDFWVDTDRKDTAKRCRAAALRFFAPLMDDDDSAGA